jgi:transcription antitermination factor NusG
MTQQETEHEKHWCAVYTKPQKEEFAEYSLRLRGVETFFPKLFLPNAARRKKQIVALFPNYLFVNVEAFSDDMAAVTWCPGVNRLVSFNGVPAIVEPLTMTFLMDQARTDGVIHAHCNIKIGDRVGIAGGPFDGLVGIIQEPPTARGRVKILLQLLNRSTKVEVPIQFIKASWVASGLSA